MDVPHSSSFCQARTRCLYLFLGETACPRVKDLFPSLRYKILLGLSYLDANADPLLFPTRRIKGLAMSEKVAAALPVIVKPSFWKKRARQEKQLGLVALKA